MQGIFSAKPKMEITVISDEMEAFSFAIQHADEDSFIDNCSDETKKALSL